MTVFLSYLPICGVLLASVMATLAVILLLLQVNSGIEKTECISGMTKQVCWVNILIYANTFGCMSKQVCWVNILIYANTFGCMSKNAHQAAYMALSLASYYLHIIHTSLWEMSFNYSYYLLCRACE